MADKATPTGRKKHIRELAEEKLRAGGNSGFDKLSVKDTRRLVHELRVHQIELEMQNEELRRIQEEIDTSRARYFDLYDLAPVGYLTVSEKGLVLEANFTTAKLLGLDRSGLVKQRITTFIFPDDQDIYYHHRRLLFENGSPQVCEMRMLRRDGSSFWTRLEAAMAQDNENQERVCRIALSDITTYKLMEEKKEQLQVQLQQSQKSEAIGVLAGGIAHEFNNLLQAINGYAQVLLLDKTKDDPEYSNLIAIDDAGTRAAQLVKQLLLFSRKHAIQIRSVNLNEEVGKALRILEQTIPKMIDIEVHLSGDLWRIKADPVQVQQILLNLGGNSADAMPEGGNFIIKTENVIFDKESTWINSNVRSEKYILLTVSDTGDGMDRKTIEKIFDPFFTTKEIGKGTGLGLASVHGIVESHGGYIGCESQVGQGTTFKIYLPASEPMEKGESTHPSTQLPYGKNETILVVDDEMVIRGFVEKILKRFSYNTLTASSGEEALEIYSHKMELIDLVILDIGMRGIGGHRCLQELIRKNKLVRVLVASGYSSAAQMKNTLQAGAAGYIEKPYQVSNLLEKIRTTLDEQVYI